MNLDLCECVVLCVCVCEIVCVCVFTHLFMLHLSVYS